MFLVGINKIYISKYIPVYLINKYIFYLINTFYIYSTYIRGTACFLCKVLHNTIRVKKYFVLKNKKALEPSLFGVFIEDNSVYCGIDLSDIKLPDKCVFLGILRETKVISATDNPSIFAGDYILAIATHPMMIPALKVTLKKIHSVYYSLNSCLLEARPTDSQFVNSDYSELSSTFNSTSY